MPIGLKFQREHRFLGYKLKYFYYFWARRDILSQKMSYGEANADKTICIIKPDYQDGVEGLLSLVVKQVLYIDDAKRRGYIPFVDWKNYYCLVHQSKQNINPVLTLDERANRRKLKNLFLYYSIKRKVKSVLGRN